jgi:hypothetical protein
MARASAPRSVRVAFQRNSAPYDVYFETTVALTTSWQEQVVSFTPSTSDARALFNFNVGASSGQLWIDDVSLSAKRSVGASPSAQINNPTAPALYRAGDTIAFSGAATDAEDGQLPETALTWEVAFHHDAHTHPYVEPYSGASQGTFVASDTGETSANVWYRIHLTATDSDGNTHSDTLDVLPVTSRLTLATQPAGLSLNLDGSPIVAPHQLTGVVAFLREIGAPASQTVNGTEYRFVSWTDSGAATHSISTPSADTTLTAIYEAQGQAMNLFANPGFDNPTPGWLAPWRLNLRSPATASLTREAQGAQSGAAARMSITRAASLDWYVQLAQPNVPLTAATTYRLSFWARASSARSVRLALQRNTAPHPIYFERSFTLSTAWQQHSIEFVAPATDPRALFNLNVGNSVGSVWLDSFSLTVK